MVQSPLGRREPTWIDPAWSAVKVASHFRTWDAVVPLAKVYSVVIVSASWTWLAVGVGGRGRGPGRRATRGGRGHRRRPGHRGHGERHAGRGVECRSTRERGRIGRDDFGDGIGLGLRENRILGRRQG